MFVMLTKDEQGPKVGEHEEMIRREPFGKWLPYVAYHEESGAYENGDNSVGFLWECNPLNFISGAGLTNLSGLLRQEYPADTVMQFILSPDSYIEPILDAYMRLKTRDNDVSRLAAQKYAEHLREGIEGMEKMRGIPVRNFRLFVAVKSGSRLADEQISMIEEALQRSHLAPRKLKPGPLLEWLRRVFNTTVPDNPQAYCDSRPLRTQVISSEYPVDNLPGGTLKIGDRYAACLTPKTLPRRVESLDMNKLIGGYRGAEDDSSQLGNDFIWTTTVFFKASAGAIKSGASWMMAQRAGGTIAKTIGRRVQELDWVLDDLENQPYVNVLMSCWVFGDDENDLNKGIARVRSLWEAEDFVMQRENAKGIVTALLIIGLPFGLYMDSSNLTTLDRDFKVSAAAAARLLPVQADFAGHMRPVLLYIGRKGQLASVDVFDPGANNYNYLVCANSGAGKSFQTNFLVSNYYGTGSFIRAVDIGYSYEKQCLIQGGRFLDVGDPRNQIVLNPFASSRKSDNAEDTQGDLQMAAKILLLMAFSNTGTSSVTETHNSLAKDAVRFALERDGGEMGIDHAYEYFSTYPKHAGELKFEGAIPLANEMAFNLRDFCSRGVYGRIFNGKSNFNIASDQFVVLELERLLTNAQLFSVISMQVINAITQDLYLSDRSTQRFMLFDEAWKYLGAGDVQVNTELISGVIMEGYRRARKYSGSTGIITQSPLDLEKFGPVGEIIKANSAFKFFLESDDYAEADRRGIIDYKGLQAELALSVKNKRPNYSEILFDTPFGIGVGRLCVDRWTYWMNTSSGADFARFRQEIQAGLSPLDALNKLASGG